MMQIAFKGKVVTNFTLLPQQGFSNENYTFTLDNKTYLLRKFKLKDRDRKEEFAIQTMASKAGLAAKPYSLNLREGYMICEFLEGHHKEKLERDDIGQMVAIIKRVHQLKCVEPVLDIKNEFTVLDKELKEAFKIIDNTPKEFLLCHNDLNSKNCLFSKQGLKLIDWEFAGLNDRYFDLAAVSVEFQFELLDEAYMLALYFGSEGWNKEKLDAYKVIYKALCTQWFKENP